MKNFNDDMDKIKNNSQIDYKKTLYNIFSDKNKIRDGKIIIYNKPPERSYAVNLDMILEHYMNFYERLKNNIIEDYNRPNATLESNKNLLVQIEFFEYFSVKMLTKFKCNSKKYKELEIKVNDAFECLKKNMSKKDYYSSLALVMYPERKGTEGQSGLVDENSILTEDDVIFAAKRLAKKEDIKENFEYFIIPLMLTNKLICSKCKEEKLFEGIKQISFDKNGIFFDIIKKLDIKHIKIFVEYLSPQTIIDLYIDKMKELEDGADSNKKQKEEDIKEFEKFLKKYSTAEDLVFSNRKFSEIYTVLEKNIYTDDLTEIFWKIYEKDIFKSEDVLPNFQVNLMERLCVLGYVSEDEIINMYNEQKKHKLASELNKTAKISEEKLLEFFSPRTIMCILSGITIDKNCNKIRKKQQEKIKRNRVTFIKSDLNRIYKEHGMNLQNEVLSLIDRLYKEKDEYTDQIRYEDIKNLYCSGIIKISDLANMDDMLTKQESIKLYNELGALYSTLIELYNYGFISSDFVMSECFNDNKSSGNIMELLKGGINPEFLLEFYKTQDILDLIQSDSLKFDINNEEQQIVSLSKLRPVFDYEIIKKKYKDGTVNYDLLIKLENIGLLTSEERLEIEESYDYEKKIEDLKRLGIVVSSSRPEPSIINKNNKNSVKDKSQKPVSAFNILDRISDSSKRDLYQGIDSEYFELDVVGKAYNGYKVVCFPNLRIGMFEYNENTSQIGGSVVLPLKVILEQVDDSKIISDEISKANSRYDIKNIKFAKALNHSPNWPRNMIKKMAELNPEIDAKKLMEENDIAIQLVSEEIKYSKEKKSQRKEH